MSDAPDIAIKISDVSKRFKLPHEKHGSIKNIVVNAFRGMRSFELQHALKSVSFEVKKGEFFGIIGRNGGGKSTLLKTLAGIYSPNEGAVVVNGSLTPFIELGVGFNPELTGRDNVFLNGALLGFSDKEMLEMYDDIVSFAELKPFMDQKLKNYSSGMQVRLAFSIAIRAKSDILLIDEVLAVGDTNFQKKCIEVFEQLKRSGTTIVFVSHSMNYVRDFCDRVAVIAKGELVFLGDTEKGIDIYNQLNAEEENLRNDAENKTRRKNVNRLGNGKALITKYELLNADGKKSTKFISGKEFTARMVISADEEVENCSTGVMFKRDPQENLYGLNSFTSGQPIEKIAKGETIEVTFRDTMPLNPGTYFVSFELASMKQTGYEDIDYLVNVQKITVTGPEMYWGVVSSSPKIQIKKLPKKGDDND